MVYGGNCTGYEGTQICYNSVCSQGKCVVPPRVRSATKSRIEDGNMGFKEVVWAKTVMLDKDGKGIEDELSRIVITDLETNQTQIVFHSGETEYPEIPVRYYFLKIN